MMKMRDYTIVTPFKFYVMLSTVAVSLTTSYYNDVQLSGMRAVRRMPHHGRAASNPRTRRAANLQYQGSPSSTLMVLSPGDRDREAMDPIAGKPSAVINC